MYHSSGRMGLYLGATARAGGRGLKWLRLRICSWVLRGVRPSTGEKYRTDCPRSTHKNRKRTVSRVLLVGKGYSVVLGYRLLVLLVYSRKQQRAAVTRVMQRSAGTRSLTLLVYINTGSPTGSPTGGKWGPIHWLFYYHPGGTVRVRLL